MEDGKRIETLLRAFRLLPEEQQKTCTAYVRGRADGYADARREEEKRPEGGAA